MCCIKGEEWGGEYKRRLTTSVRESPTSNLMKKHGPGRGGVRKSDEERETGGCTNEVKSKQKEQEGGGGGAKCGQGWLGVIVNAKSIKAL